MNALPFSVFKRADRSCFSVSFKDPTGKYLRPVSTGKKTEAEAIQAAFEMYRDGIPQNQNTYSVQDLSFREMARNVKTGEEAEIILNELNRLGLVKSFVLNSTPKAENFILFLTAFWNWDESPYILETSNGKHMMKDARASLFKYIEV